MALVKYSSTVEGCTVITPLTNGTGQSTGSTFVMANVPGTGYSASVTAAIEQNFVRLMTQFNALLATMKANGLMQSS